MKTYCLEAKLLAPLALKRDRQSDRSETVRSIPGTTLRGALAQLYLQQQGQANGEFRRLFLDENECRFGPLDPADRVIPMTVVACKRQPLRHPRSDHLWLRTAQHLTENRLPPAALARFRQCPQCGADRKAHAGFWTDRAGLFEEAADNRHVLSAHVGIDRTTSTAADAVFYTLEAIAPGSRQRDLVGWVQATDGARDLLRALLDSENGVAYIGHHRTRGYGKVRLSLLDDPIAETPGDDAENEWLRCSDDLIRFVNDISRSATVEANRPFAELNTAEDLFFSLSLPTGAILVDHLLRYTTDPAAMLSWLPPVPDPSCLFPLDERPSRSTDRGTLRCLAAVTRQHLLRGWNGAHGLPRQDEWMVGRGAVYAYWFHGPQQQRHALCERLQSLEASGIGLRRNEGYGRIVVDDPLHARLALQEIAR